MRLAHLDPNDPWDAGWLAYKAHKAKTDNPMLAPDDGAAWERGFDDATYFEARKDKL